MNATLAKLEKQLQEIRNYFINAGPEEIIFKSSPEKWSKKEILGHLIDSGINNLQRFTEIQFETKPYRVRKYNQDKLVLANDYQNAAIEDLLSLWLNINKRILDIVKNQSEKTLKYKVLIGEQGKANLHFLITDYVDHMKHHLEQIMQSANGVKVAAN